MACQNVSSDWQQLARHLNIDGAIVDGIEDRRGERDAEWCIDELLSAWLRHDSPDHPTPTWQLLCNAIEKINLSLATRIRTEHGLPYGKSIYY